MAQCTGMRIFQKYKKTDKIKIKIKTESKRKMQKKNEIST
jgi:hypothetical protein